MTATVAGIHLGIDTHANRPAANTVPDGSIYSCSTHGLLYKSNLAGNSWATYATLGGSGETVAGSTIWDAAGDTVVATGADAAARLAIGAVGGHLSRINGAVAWNSGTSNPGSAAAGDRYWRSDLSLATVYDGTRWLTMNQYTDPMQPETNMAGAITASGSYMRWIDWKAGNKDVWIEEIQLMTYHSAITGGNFWTCQLIKGTAAESETNVGSSFVTSSDTSANWTSHVVTVGALLGTTNRYIRASLTKSGSATALYIHGRVVYRLVIT